jgi:hypothetical protein
VQGAAGKGIIRADHESDSESDNVSDSESDNVSGSESDSESEHKCKARRRGRASAYIDQVEERDGDTSDSDASGNTTEDEDYSDEEADLPVADVVSGTKLVYQDFVANLENVPGLKSRAHDIANELFCAFSCVAEPSLPTDTSVLYGVITLMMENTCPACGKAVRLEVPDGDTESVVVNPGVPMAVMAPVSRLVCLDCAELNEGFAKYDSAPSSYLNGLKVSSSASDSSVSDSFSSDSSSDARSAPRIMKRARRVVDEEDD